MSRKITDGFVGHFSFNNVPEGVQFYECDPVIEFSCISIVEPPRYIEGHFDVRLKNDWLDEDQPHIVEAPK